jgi:hypothetical protein
MGKSSSGQNLCQDGSIQINFTTFNWPIGTKMDRGLNISFPGDVTLWPQESITGSAGSNDVMISFKDAKKVNPYRCALLLPPPFFLAFTSCLPCLPLFGLSREDMLALGSSRCKDICLSGMI